MPKENNKEIKTRVQKEVYDDTIKSLAWHRAYHEKAMLKYVLSGDAHLYIINYERYKAYDELLNALKHFKF